jgi:hypothetical protein
MAGGSTCPTATMRVDMDSVMDSDPRTCRCHQARRKEGVTWQLVLQDCAVAAVTQLRLPADDMEHVSIPGRLVMHHDSHKQWSASLRWMEGIMAKVSPGSHLSYDIALLSLGRGRPPPHPLTTMLRIEPGYTAN